MRYGSDNGLLVFGVDQRRTLGTLWKQKTMMVISLTVSGRARQSCVDETHELGGFSLSKGSERKIEVRWPMDTIVRSGEAAVFSRVRLAILA